MIRSSDQITFFLELASCDASTSAITVAMECDVTVLTLRQEPFNLIWGDSVWAKVTATNVYGDSVQSVEGNGAVIITYADAPLYL